MSELIFPNVNYGQTSQNLLVDSRLKICIECGHSIVDKYEFGISCEDCGILLIYNPVKKSGQKWRELRK